MPIPLGLSPTQILQQPHDNSKYIALTDANQVVEFDERGLCKTLQGPDTIISCPYQHLCNPASDSTDIVQVSYNAHSNNSISNHIYVLRHGGLFFINSRDCNHEEISKFDSSVYTPKYLDFQCGNANFALVLMSKKVNSVNQLEMWSIDLQTGTFTISSSTPSAFMSGYRLPVSNHDCTKALEVAISSTLTDIRKYAWFGHKLAAYDAPELDIQQVRNVDKTTIIRWTIDIPFEYPIHGIGAASDGKHLLAFSSGIGNVLSLQTERWHHSGNGLFYEVPNRNCGPVPSMQLSGIEDIEACAYKCLKNDICRGYQLNQNDCQLYHYLELSFSAGSSGNSCYVFDA